MYVCTCMSCLYMYKYVCASVEYCSKICRPCVYIYMYSTCTNTHIRKWPHAHNITCMCTYMYMYPCTCIVNSCAGFLHLLVFMYMYTIHVHVRTCTYIHVHVGVFNWCSVCSQRQSWGERWCCSGRPQWWGWWCQQWGISLCRTHTALSIHIHVHDCTQLYSVHVELVPHIALIHSTIRGCIPCAIDYSRGFWYGTLPCPITFRGC